MEVILGKNQGRRVMRINAAECAGLVVDIQERLFPHMHGSEEFLGRVHILLEGLKVLDVPVLVTEQYPRGWEKPSASLLKFLRQSNP